MDPPGIFQNVNDPSGPEACRGDTEHLQDVDQSLLGLEEPVLVLL